LCHASIHTHQVVASFFDYHFYATYHLFVPCSPKNIGETYELPQLPASDASIVQYNPAYGKIVPSRPDHIATESNPAYGHFRSSRLERDEEEKEESHIYL